MLLLMLFCWPRKKNVRLLTDLVIKKRKGESEWARENWFDTAIATWWVSVGMYPQDHASNVRPLYLFPCLWCCVHRHHYHHLWSTPQPRCRKWLAVKCQISLWLVEMSCTQYVCPRSVLLLLSLLVVGGSYRDLSWVNPFRSFSLLPVPAKRDMFPDDVCGNKQSTEAARLRIPIVSDANPQ